MSREKQYKRSQLLDKAIVLFRRNGYHATSTAELTEELGINKKTMYNEFGSKLNLFQATLEHYNETFLSLIFSPIEKEDASIEDVIILFQTILKFGTNELKGLGCLMCNTSSERSSLDPCIGPLIDNYYSRIQLGFQNALMNSLGEHNNKPSVNIKKTASFLTTTLIGMATSVRAEAPEYQLKGTYQFIENYIRSL